MKYIRKYNESTTIKATDDTIREIVYDEIDKLGIKCDLNHINVSRITTMIHLFYDSNFNGDISDWNVRNVINMRGMFLNSPFNGHISKWNVGNVKDMNSMFSYSNFNGDISNWNVGNVNNMRYMFMRSNFNGDISKWNVRNVIDMGSMFYFSKFNGDISGWNVRNVQNIKDMFYGSIRLGEPWWYVLGVEFSDMRSMYKSIEVYEWIDVKKGIIWRKRLNYALQDFGKEGYEIPQSTSGFIYR